MQGHLRLAQRFVQVKHLIDAVQGVADLPLAVGCKNPSVLAGNEAEVSLGRRAVKVCPQGVPSCIGEIPVRLVAIHDGHLSRPGGEMFPLCFNLHAALQNDLHQKAVKGVSLQVIPRSIAEIPHAQHVKQILPA